MPFYLTRRRFNALCGAVLAVGCTAARPRDRAAPVTRIAFGSCARQGRPQPIWTVIADHRPDVFIFLGDTVYGDTEDMNVLRRKYAMLGAEPGFQRLRAAASVVGTWDDHDYGRNDAGAEYPMKRESKQIFLDFFGEPRDSERRTRDGGLYTSYLYGPPGRRLQLILLDTRYDRSPTLKVPKAERAALRDRGVGPYRPNLDPAARLLGEDQWTWLAAQLRTPAEIRILGSSIQVLSDFTGREGWANLPLERERLIRLIAETAAGGVVFISGDVHYAEIAARRDGAPYRLWEATSSSLNQSATVLRPNRNRIAGPWLNPNFGMMHIDWDAPDPTVRLEIRSAKDEIMMRQVLRRSELAPA